MRPGWMAGAPGASGTPPCSATSAGGTRVRLTETRGQLGSPREVPLEEQTEAAGLGGRLLDSKLGAALLAASNAATQAEGCAC
mmetsp:Transcript_38860/g.95361  ORF Transcript_38860/g.95361 Transcript_38860/m.95361 type:complete len:83 (-) Transcript_38860:137-385(-)